MQIHGRHRGAEGGRRGAVGAGVQAARLLRTIINIATEMDLKELNELPSLYRIEIKKALRESGNQQRAEQLRT